MSVRAGVREALARVPGAVPLARLVRETVRVAMRYRVTGLASEAGFFALLSLPPLIFGLFGGVGYVARWLGPDTTTEVTEAIERYASRFLTDEAVQGVILPTVNDVFGSGRTDVISLGLLLSVWSGSRALNVFVDTISIMYGQSGVRGILRTRLLSLSLYFLTVVIGGLVMPLVLIGPALVRELLTGRLEFLAALYWPVVVLVTVASLTSLFHVSTPRRSPFLRDLPGAVLTLVIWLLSSWVLRFYLGASVGGGNTSIYGPLAAPIVVLIYLYFLSIAVLIGAAFNSAVRRLWPTVESPSSRARLVQWAREESARRRAAGRARQVTPMPEPAAEDVLDAYPEASSEPSGAALRG